MTVSGIAPRHKSILLLVTSCMMERIVDVEKKKLSRPDFNEAPNNPSANEPESLPTCSGIRVYRIIFIFESDVAMGSKPVSAKCVTDHLK